MKIAKQTEDYLVIDDFLDASSLSLVQEQVECESYSAVALGDDKVYKLNSGLIYKSQNKFWLSKSPWSNNYQPFASALNSFLKESLPFIPDFADVSMMVHSYTSGAELSWHRDTGVLGGYTFYCHREWHHMWGGNLLLTMPDQEWEGVRWSTPPDSKTDLKDSFGRLYGAKGVTFDHELEKRILQSPGIGEFIMPLPNRLVILSSRLAHKVERVDQAAGMNCRTSLTGFFTSEKAKN